MASSCLRFVRNYVAYRFLRRTSRKHNLVVSRFVTHGFVSFAASGEAADISGFGLVRRPAISGALEAWLGPG